MPFQAAQKPKGSIERLLLVAAFAQSAFQAVGKLKCMVPIMNETYEVRLLSSAVPGAAQLALLQNLLLDTSAVLDSWRRTDDRC